VVSGVVGLAHTRIEARIRVPAAWAQVVGREVMPREWATSISISILLGPRFVEERTRRERSRRWRMILWFAQRLGRGIGEDEWRVCSLDLPVVGRRGCRRWLPLRFESSTALRRYALPWYALQWYVLEVGRRIVFWQPRRTRAGCCRLLMMVPFAFDLESTAWDCVVRGSLSSVRGMMLGLVFCALYRRQERVEGSCGGHCGVGRGRRHHWERLAQGSEWMLWARFCDVWGRRWGRTC
jgi:hypothetical protein